MTTAIDRSTFLRRAATAAAGLAVAGPLTAYGARTAAGAPTAGEGFGPLVDMGELALPKGFRYKVISREGDPMTIGGRTPGIFDGMGAFPGPGGTTILIRNHENRRRPGEIPVPVPENLRYDPDPTYNSGNTKLVVSRDLRTLATVPVLGGISTACAGGTMPWGSWITCEEVFDQGATGVRHGYSFEIDAYSWKPAEPRPIVGAGRLVHEAVVWFRGALYQTEDREDDAALYRYVPDKHPRRPGDLARGSGKLQALAFRDTPAANTKTGWPVGKPLPITWVDLEDNDPAEDTLRKEAHTKGAALFDRQEGCWVGNGRIYFDCTSGGPADLGQIWELDAKRGLLTLLYESPGPEELKNPDNLVVTPTGDLLLCEDADPPMFLRLLTTEGEISDFARAIDAPESEFCGAVFDPSGRVLFVNQQGTRDGDDPKHLARTYAITGPWWRIDKRHKK